MIYQFENENNLKIGEFENLKMEEEKIWNVRI